MKILSIYDHGGDTVDRYTVYYDKVENGKNFYACRCMNGSPYHPQGFCQMSIGQLGIHNGKKIKLEDLPKDCQNVIQNDLKED